MKKRLWALILTLTLLSGIMVVPITAEEPEASGIVKTELFSQTFEDFSTDMTSEQIAMRLGWSSWNHDVAELRIVETVWLRDVAGKYGDVITSNETMLKELFAWDEGSNHEWSNRNHRMVDVSMLKQVQALESVDFTKYPTYTKQLLIVPKKANEDLSVMLFENLNVSNLNGNETLLVDWELTPNKLTTYGFTKDSRDIAFANTSYLGVGVSLGASKLVQGLTAEGTLLQTLRSTAAETDGSVSWNDWCRSVRDSNVGRKLYGDIHIGLGGNYNFNYETGADDPYTGKSWLLYSGSSANGLTYGFRMELSNSDFNSYVRFSHNNDADKADPSWYRVAGTSGEFKNQVRSSFAQTENLAFSLEYNDSGISFYLDNLRITKVTDNNAKEITIQVNGADYKTYENKILSIAALTENASGLLLAVATDSENVETVLGINDTVVAKEGLNIRLYTVDMTATRAEQRKNEPSGIRWVTDLSKETVESLNELQEAGKIKGIRVGTIITPRSYAEKAGACTFEKLGTLDSNYPYVQANATYGTWYAESEHSFSFAGSLVKLRNAHLDMDYVGCGYVTVILADDLELTVYSPITAEASIANAAALEQAGSAS